MYFELTTNEKFQPEFYTLSLLSIKPGKVIKGRYIYKYFYIVKYFLLNTL